MRPLGHSILNSPRPWRSVMGDRRLFVRECPFVIERALVLNGIAVPRSAVYEPEHGSPRTSPKGSARRVSHEARMPADVATWRAASIFARTKLVNSSGVLGLASAP